MLPRDPSGIPDAPVDGQSGRVASAIVAGESQFTSCGDLVEGALPSDWDAIDGQLRGLLARLGRLADAAEDGRAGLPWRLWIGAVTATFLARRAARGSRQWLIRRPALETGGSPDHHPLSEGPWPLGPP